MLSPWLTILPPVGFIYYNLYHISLCQQVSYFLSFDDEQSAFVSFFSPQSLHIYVWSRLVLSILLTWVFFPYIFGWCSLWFCYFIFLLYFLCRLLWTLCCVIPVFLVTLVFPYSYYFNGFLIVVRIIFVLTFLIVIIVFHLLMVPLHFCCWLSLYYTLCLNWWKFDLHWC